MIYSLIQEIIKRTIPSIPLPFLRYIYDSFTLFYVYIIIIKFTIEYC